MLDFVMPLVVGGVVALIGAAMLCAHAVAWRRHRDDSQLEPAEREHYRRQYSRRVQTSTLVCIIGVLLCFAHEKMGWEHLGKSSVLAYGAYILVLLMLTLWTVLLALGDFASSRLHHAGAAAKLLRERQELERLLEEQRRKVGKPQE
ncbi:MAG TPA: hypothetical protein VHB77_22495 [Planctomycetaceae bacterium]|nr:hypothetical protein [Planctomycetaceae bacterium]